MRRARSDGGAATIWFLAVVWAAVAMLSLIVDGGAILRARTEAYAGAEAAARAAANEAARGALTQGSAEIDERAASEAAAAVIGGRGLRLVSIRITPEGVTVTAAGTAALQVVSVAGVGPVTVQATATAQRRTS